MNNAMFTQVHQIGMFISQIDLKKYAPLQSRHMHPCNQRYFSHLDQFLTGFSALQVAAGGSVGRQELDLGKYGNNLTSW